MAEFGWCENDIVFISKNLEKWAKDEAAPDIPFVMKALGPKIRKEPIGTVLVIGYVLRVLLKLSFLFWATWYFCVPLC